MNLAEQIKQISEKIKEDVISGNFKINFFNSDSVTVEIDGYHVFVFLNHALKKAYFNSYDFYSCYLNDEESSEIYKTIYRGGYVNMIKSKELDIERLRAEIDFIKQNNKL